MSGAAPELEVGQVWTGPSHFLAGDRRRIIALEKTRVKWQDVSRPEYEVWETREAFGRWAKERAKAQEDLL